MMAIATWIHIFIRKRILNLLNVHRDLARARAIELDEVNALPGSEDEFSFFVRPRKRRADQHREKVCVGVALAVTELDVGNESAERFGEIRGDIRIGILVDRDGAG